LKKLKTQLDDQNFLCRQTFGKWELKVVFGGDYLVENGKSLH
jgi:hypothetical protein